MIKSNLLAIATFLFVINATQLKADDVGIQFEKTTWEQVKQKAKSENKLIFVDAFTTWCGPCKMMSQNVFTDKEVGDFYNKNFISFKYDMEKGEGVDFARKYEVTAYPTFLYFSSDGELVHRIVGAQNVDNFITFGKNAMNPETQVYALAKRFENGERSAPFINQYLQALSGANENTEEVASEYLKNIKKEQWSSPENWEIISGYIYDSSSEAYQYVAQHKEAFSSANSSDEVTDYLTDGLLDGLRPLIESQDEAQLSAFKIQCKNILEGEEADAVIALTEMYFYQYDEEKGYKYMVNYFDNYCNDAEQLNSIAWNFFENFTEEDKLEKALEWVNRSVELDGNFYNMDTKANLLHSLGKNKAALESAEKAVELGKAIGENTSETERLVSEIKESLND